MSVLVTSNGRRAISPGVVGVGIGTAVAFLIAAVVAIAPSIPSEPGAVQPVAPAGAATAPDMFDSLREHSLRENGGAGAGAAGAASGSAVSEALREHTLRENAAAAGAGAAGTESTAPDRLRGHLEREWRSSGTITTGGSSSIGQELYNHSLRENRGQ